MSNVANSLRLTGFRRISWPYPEWWALSICLIAWWLILFGMPAGASSHGHGHHAVPAMMRAGILTTWPEQIVWWLVMVAAMMFPLLTAHIRNIAARSLWMRRHRAIGAFLAGYVAPWLIFGAAATGALLILEMNRGTLPRVFVAAGFFLALVWQLLSVRRRAVLACHRTRPIAPAGWRADRDCFKYGWMIGGSCVVSCWALMLACLLTGHSAAAMIGTTGILLWERRAPRPKQLYFCIIIVAMGVIALLTA